MVSVSCVIFHLQQKLRIGGVETVMTWHCVCFVRVGKADGNEDKTA
jgi:hypothetical protein